MFIVALTMIITLPCAWFIVHYVNDRGTKDQRPADRISQPPPHVVIPQPVVPAKPIRVKLTFEPSTQVEFNTWFQENHRGEAPPRSLDGGIILRVECSDGELPPVSLTSEAAPSPVKIACTDAMVAKSLVVTIGPLRSRERSSWRVSTEPGPAGGEFEIAPPTIVLLPRQDKETRAKGGPSNFLGYYLVTITLDRAMGAAR